MGWSKKYKQSIDCNNPKGFSQKAHCAGRKKKENVMSSKLEELVGKPITEEQFDEAAGKKDACYHKVKARYDVWPSAYASGALVKCRKVGAKNWGNKSKKEGVDEAQRTSVSKSELSKAIKQIRAKEKKQIHKPIGATLIMKLANELNVMASIIYKLMIKYKVGTEYIKGVRFESLDEGDIESRELKISIDNDGQLYNQRYMPILKNLTKKMKKGNYDKKLAAKLFMYLVNDGVKKYVKDFGGSPSMFSKSDRIAVAKEFVEEFEEIYKNKEYKFMEGFASDAQRKAAFASGYKAKGKKKKKEGVNERDNVAMAYKRTLFNKIELKKLKDAIEMFQKKIKKQGSVTNARDEEHLKNLIKVYKEMGGKGVRESVNEGRVLHFTQIKDKTLEKHLKVIAKKVGATVSKISGGFKVDADNDGRKLAQVVDYIFDKSLMKGLMSGGGMSRVQLVNEKKLVGRPMVKKAIQIAKKMSGNMTGAVKKIEKMMPGLSKQIEVEDALRQANEGLGDMVGKSIGKYNKKRKKNMDALKKLKKKESVEEAYDIWMEDGSFGYTMTGIVEAEYQGRKVKLGKPMQGDVKKFKVYVKNPKGNVVKVNFGQGGDAKGGTMRIRKSNPKARANFRARHNCDNPGPRHKARYWSCRKW